MPQGIRSPVLGVNPIFRGLAATRVALAVAGAVVALVLAPQVAQAAYNVTISSNPTTGVSQSGGTITATAIGANVNTNTITDAFFDAENVTVSTGTGGTQAGTITDTAEVDDIGAVESLTLDAAGTVTFNPGTAVAYDTDGSLTVDGTGVSFPNGAEMDTSGAQTYNAPVSYSDAVYLEATGSGSLSLQSVDGGGSCDVITDGGSIHLNGNVGDTTEPSAVQFGGGPITSGASSMSSTGPVDFDNPMTLENGLTVSGGGLVQFDTVDGAHGLTTTSAAFHGDVGATAALSSLSASGDPTLYNIAVSTTGDQNYPGGLQAEGTVLTSTSGSVNIDAASPLYGSLEIDGAGTISGVLSGSGGSLVKGGSGTLTLAAANTYGGATTINGGTLQTSAAGAIPSTSDVDLANSTIGPTLDLDGHTQTIGSLAGGGTAGGLVTDTNTNSATLQTGADNASTTYSGAIQDNNGTVALTKQGTGEFTFAGSDSATGATTVTSGELVVNGSIVHSSVALDGGTLAGLGSVDGIQGGTPSATLGGPAPGVFTSTAAVSLTSADTVAVNFTNASGQDFDQLDANGPISLGDATLQVTAAHGFAGAAPADVFTIIENSSRRAVTGTFAGLPQGSVIRLPNLQFVISYIGGTDGENVTLTDIGVTASVALMSSSRTSRSGSRVRFTATVSPIPGSGNTATPTGSVTFRDNSRLLGTEPLVNGTAALITRALPIGVSVVSASYSGDHVYLHALSAGVNEVVSRASPRVSSAPRTPSTTLAGTDTDTAVVTGNAVDASPAGSVSFHLCGPLRRDSGCPTGGRAVGAAVRVIARSGDTARATSPAAHPTAPGVWCFRARYSGDASYTPASDGGANECFTVRKPAAPSVTISSPAGGAKLVLDRMVDARYRCRDAPGAPGLASCKGTVPDGAPIDTTKLGRHRFSVTAISKDRERTTHTVIYTVVRPARRRSS